MVKIVDRRDEKEIEDRHYRSMLEIAAEMFGGRNVSALNGLSITVYHEADIKRERAVIGIDTISSLIHLYDAEYLTRVKKLAAEYEFRSGREPTIELEY